MSSNWKHIKNSVKGEFSDAVTTTKKYLKIGKGKFHLMKINKSLNDTFLKLGIKVYNEISEEIKGDTLYSPEVKSLIEKVNQLKQFKKDEELEIDGLKKESVQQTKTVEDKDNSPNVKVKEMV